MPSAPDLFSPDDPEKPVLSPGPRAFQLKAKPENLRKFLRFTIDGITATLYVKSLLNTLGIARRNRSRAVLNLSEGGVMVLTTERIPLKTKVRVRLEIEKFRDVIETDGEVR